MTALPTSSNSGSPKSCSHCAHAGHPPFVLDWSHGQPLPNPWWKSEADFRHIQAAPHEAKLIYVRSRQICVGPCSWLDTANQSCKYHDFRPETCRETEPQSLPPAPIN